MTQPYSISGESTYKAAAAIAETVVNIFTQHLDEATAKGEKDLASVPSAYHVEQILDTAFWASLRREEGNSPKVSLAFLSPDQAGLPLRFEYKLTFSPNVLTKLGPGVERPGVHLGVWYDQDGLYIWGTTHKIPNYCFVLDVSEPGLLVIKHRRSNGFGKFTNIVVLIGDQIKMVDESSRNLPDCPVLLTSLLGFTSASPNHSVNVLIQIATSMRAHKHGGTLLVVPSGTEAWKESIIHPMKYSISPAFSGLSDLMRQDIENWSNGVWQGELSREIDSIAGLTAIDGATVITDKHEVVAFGAKIGRTEGSARVERVLITEPIIGGEGVIVNPAMSGGTRHMSAAQFVHDQKDAIALVASQDGIFTIFTWSPCENMVHAHRIDSLLL
ncbi:MAG: putative sensor domain DACNV-containing protein [Daejeonella sp.]|uniref:putative sensor domain DACNV-containing protein n=1 Tax=Daejeonella sp. TaxID=2805397 RepID=UPI003C753E52